MIIITAPQRVWREAKDFLLGAKDERFGFFLASCVTTAQDVRFCIQRFLPIPDARADTAWEAERSVTLDALLEAINAAKKEGLTLIECHTHPLTRKGVRFSEIDDEGMEETAAYVVESLKQPYAALVLGHASADARAWIVPGEPIPVDRITIAGERLDVVLPTSSPRDERVDTERYARHIDLFSAEGQKRIALATVAIVGTSGLGSHVVQQLVYLGARRFILIDPDVVARTNLNRMVGATPRDIDEDKVEVLPHYIRSIAPDAHVETIADDLRSPLALDALARADIVFGCVDNDGARLVLNEASRAYHLPLFDAASGITATDGQFEQAGGRVCVVRPDGPCLLCMGEIDRREAAYFLAPEDKRALDRRLGYVDGWEANAPSVVSLNGAVASMAVTEYMLYVTGLGTPATCTYYYLREPGGSAQRANARAASKSDKCFTCALEGAGDKANLARYAPGGDAASAQ